MHILSYLKKNLFEAPYPLLPLAVWGYFVLAFLLDVHSSFHLLRLLDTDDYMRLDETINWLQSAHPLGAGWYDLSQPRLSPNEHAVVHWARLVDLPIAFFMLPFLRIFGFMQSAFLASMIVPPLLFGLLLAVAPFLARPFVGVQRANLACVIILFLPAIIFNFSPGRVDHHAYQILIAAFCLSCLDRMMFNENGWKFAIAAGVAFACGLWIGAEAVPWIVLFAINLVFLAGWRGKTALRNAGVFGAALALATMIVLPLALPSAQFGDRSTDWFSMAYVVFAILMGSVFVIGWALGRMSKAPVLRIALLAAIGLFAAILFFSFVPSVLNGPYTDYDTVTTSLILDHVGEAQPFLEALGLHLYNPISFLHAAPAALHYILLPLLALITIFWNIFYAKKQMRPLWIAHAIFLFPAILLTLIWQLRVIYFAEIYALMPLTWLVWRGWEWAGAKLKGRPRFWAEIAIFMLIAPLPVLLIPDAVSGAAIYPDLVFFPVSPANGACDLTTASSYLAAKDTYGDRPRVILSGINEGAELLLRTPHIVLSAPYNIRSNHDVYDFFDARTDAPARSILKKYKVDLVLVCRNIPYFYAGLDGAETFKHAYFSVDKTGNLQMASSKDHPALIERLAIGRPPDWLKRVEIPGNQDYLLYEVRK